VWRNQIAEDSSDSYVSVTGLFCHAFGQGLCIGSTTPHNSKSLGPSGEK
jgi:hypothetical protein